MIHVQLLLAAVAFLSSPIQVKCRDMTAIPPMPRPPTKNPMNPPQRPPMNPPKRPPMNPPKRPIQEPDKLCTKTAMTKSTLTLIWVFFSMSLLWILLELCTMDPKTSSMTRTIMAFLTFPLSMALFIMGFVDWYY
jgi:hypothetical protein